MAAKALQKTNLGVLWAARVLTGLLSLIMIFFGTKYFGDPEVISVINGQLGYPRYILPFIGATHILGGFGLLIPNMPRLTEWVYAGLVFDLMLAAFSHVSSGDSFSNTAHPLGLAVVLMLSYMLRRQLRPNIWKDARK